MKTIFQIVTSFVLLATCFSQIAFQSQWQDAETGKNNDRTVPDSDSVPGMVFGDIKYPFNQETGKLLTRYVRTWPNGSVPYVIDPSISNRNVVLQAMDEISRLSCITFKARTTEVDHVIFRANSQNRGCWAMIGRAGGAQTINLDPNSGCQYKGVVIHEILHALGFFHEQSRTDRDNYVTINWSNIVPSAKQNFEIEYNAVSTADSYDYSSIMHYGARDFAINRYVATITPKKAGVQIGQKIAMSAADIRRLKKIYNCPSNESQPATTTVSTSQCYCPCLTNSNGSQNIPVIV